MKNENILIVTFMTLVLILSVFNSLNHDHINELKTIVRAQEILLNSQQTDLDDLRYQINQCHMLISR
jgi:cell division protein FtsL